MAHLAISRNASISDLTNMTVKYMKQKRVSKDKYEIAELSGFLQQIWNTIALYKGMNKAIQVFEEATKLSKQ